MIALARQHGLWLVIGFVLWSTAFVALYGLHALGCAWNWGENGGSWTNALRMALTGVWGVHLALIGLLIPYLRRRRSHASKERAATLHTVALALTVAALIATIWIGIPVLMLPICV